MKMEDQERIITIDESKTHAVTRVISDHLVKAATEGWTIGNRCQFNGDSHYIHELIRGEEKRFMEFDLSPCLENFSYLELGSATLAVSLAMRRTPKTRPENTDPNADGALAVLTRIADAGFLCRALGANATYSQIKEACRDLWNDGAALTLIAEQSPTHVRNVLALRIKILDFISQLFMLLVLGVILAIIVFFLIRFK